MSEPISSRQSPMLLIAQACLESGLSLFESLDLLEKHLILEALEEARGNKCKAAKLLRIHRNTLLRKIEQLKIPSRAGRPERKLVKAQIAITRGAA